MTGILFTTASVVVFAAIDRLWGAPKGKTPAKILAGASIATLFLLDWRYAAMAQISSSAGLLALRME